MNIRRKIIEINFDNRQIIHDLRKQVGALFFARRAEKNISLRKLSLETGIKEERIDRLETGRAKFDHSAVITLLRKYKVKTYIIFCCGEDLKFK